MGCATTAASTGYALARYPSTSPSDTRSDFLLTGGGEGVSQNGDVQYFEAIASAREASW
ncbi:MAG: hypothetical protein ABWX56_10135 [Mycetocola sp.]